MDLGGRRLASCDATSWRLRASAGSSIVATTAGACRRRELMGLSICRRTKGGGGLWGEVSGGTEHPPANEGRIDIRLTMLGNPDHGVLLHYQKSGRDYREAYYSRGDLRRLREGIEAGAGGPMTIR